MRGGQPVCRRHASYNGPRRSETSGAADFARGLPEAYLSKKTRQSASEDETLLKIKAHRVYIAVIPGKVNRLLFAVKISL
jgi:hypothetical protein